MRDCGSWNQKDRIILMEMWEKNCSGKEIAMVLGRTRSAVMGKIARLRLQHKNASKRKSKVKKIEFKMPIYTLNTDMFKGKRYDD